MVDGINVAERLGRLRVQALTAIFESLLVGSRLYTDSVQMVLRKRLIDSLRDTLFPIVAAWLVLASQQDPCHSQNPIIWVVTSRRSFQGQMVGDIRLQAEVIMIQCLKCESSVLNVS